MMDSVVFDNKIRIGDREIYLVMLDYDTHDRDLVWQDIKDLQKLHDLSTATIYETRQGYHVVFFYDLISSWADCMKIVLDSQCDQKYKDVALETGKINTRISVKYEGPDKTPATALDLVSMSDKDIDTNTKIIGNMTKQVYNKLLALQIDLDRFMGRDEQKDKAKDKQKDKKNESKPFYDFSETDNQNKKKTESKPFYDF